MRLSLRDSSDGYIGTAEQWRQAESALRTAAAEVLASEAAPLVEAEGEAAFYGPKLDLQVRDGRGHEESIATVQLDFNQPERFDLTYVAADGTKRRVVMIHRGTVGSMERVVAALIERYQGRLPLWLSPVQVCVLPVRPEHDGAARAFVDELVGFGLRARLDPDGSLAGRVRASRQRRDSLIGVVGAKEVLEGTVQVTDVGTGFEGAVRQRALVELVRDAYTARATQIAWPESP